MSNPSADMFRAQVEETNELIAFCERATMGPVSTQEAFMQVLQNQCHIMQGMVNIIETLNRLDIRI